MRVTVDRVQSPSASPGTEMAASHGWAETEVRGPAVVAARRPAPGERALGYSVSGLIVVVPEFQPLAADAIWRVVLVGGSVGHLVRRDEQDYASGTAGWLPLQLDDLTDAQIASVVTYIRNSWGNAAPAVTEADVATVRKAVAVPGK